MPPGTTAPLTTCGVPGPVEEKELPSFLHVSSVVKQARRMNMQFRIALESGRCRNM
jgi:hypothetical protein